MKDALEIKGQWQKSGPLIEIDYSPAQMFQPKTSALLSEKLVNEYRTLREAHDEEEPKFCILWIKATTAGSPLVRAIFELYKVLHADSATLICACYPVAYMESLTSLGLPTLPGFILATSVEEALSRSERIA